MLVTVFFSDEETEAGYDTCPKSYRWSVLEAGFKFNRLGFKVQFGHSLPCCAALDQLSTSLFLERRL